MKLDAGAKIPRYAKPGDAGMDLYAVSQTFDDHGNYVQLTLELFVKNLKLFLEKKELSNQIDKKLGYQKIY